LIAARAQVISTASRPDLPSAVNEVFAKAKRLPVVDPLTAGRALSETKLQFTGAL
jgi:hypothetical protein